MCSVELQNLDAEYLVYGLRCRTRKVLSLTGPISGWPNYMYIKKDWPKTIEYYKMWTGFS